MGASPSELVVSARHPPVKALTRLVRWSAEVGRVSSDQLTRWAIWILVATASTGCSAADEAAEIPRGVEAIRARFPAVSSLMSAAARAPAIATAEGFVIDRGAAGAGRATLGAAADAPF